MKEVTTISELKESIKANKIIVDFWAPWCGPCKVLASVLQELEISNPDITIVKINVEEAQDLAEYYNISSLPTLYFYRNGINIGVLLGNVPIQKIISVFD